MIARMVVFHLFQKRTVEANWCGFLQAACCFCHTVNGVKATNATWKYALKSEKITRCTSPFLTHQVTTEERGIALFTLAL